MFPSWSLAVQILVRERLEARCEELKSQTGNRPITLATMRKHHLVEAAVTELLLFRDRAERDTVRQLRLALAEETATWLEEANLWTRLQAPGQGGVDPRPVALVRETD